jgi:hypothetical protein
MCRVRYQAFGLWNVVNGKLTIQPQVNGQTRITKPGVGVKGDRGLLASVAIWIKESEEWDRRQRWNRLHTGLGHHPSGRGVGLREVYICVFSRHATAISTILVSIV